MALTFRSPPVLEKVKAHNAAAIAAQHSKSVGNDVADQLARLAATSPHLPVWDSAVGPFGDPVLLVDASGSPVMDVRFCFLRDWWSERCARVAVRRVWFASLYPEDVDFDFPLSTAIFRRPIFSGTSFAHSFPPATIKWIARIRTGSLATGLRRHTHLPAQVPSAGCVCCAAAEEDDAHALSGCPATGSADWFANISDTWRVASQSSPSVPLCPQRNGWTSTTSLSLLA